MKSIVHIPSDLVEPVKRNFPPPEVGVLGVIAAEAISGFLHRLEESPNWMAALPAGSASQQ